MGNMASLIVLTLLLLVIWMFDRKNFKREGLFFLRRTDKGLDVIDKFGRKYAHFFKLFGDLGIVLSFGGLGTWYVAKMQKRPLPKVISLIFSIAMFFLLKLFFSTPFAIVMSLLGAAGFITLYLIDGVYAILFKQIAVGGISLVLPVRVPSLPVFYVPIEYWLISIFVLIVVHEFSHALVSRAENIKVKSLGYGFLAILPLAFAEPDEKQLKKEKSLKKTRIYSAGSLSNIVVGSLIAVVMLLLIMPFFYTNAIAYGYVNHTAYNKTQPFPAELVNMTGAIISINGVRMESVDVFIEVMQNKKPDETILVETYAQNYNLTLVEDPNNKTKGFIGVLIPDREFKVLKEDYRESFKAVPIKYMTSLLGWLLLLNIGIGLANLMPIKPLDGGLILEEILKETKFRYWKFTYRVVAVLTLGLIFLNLFGMYLI